MYLLPQTMRCKPSVKIPEAFYYVLSNYTNGYTLNFLFPLPNPSKHTFP
jgi:hypothetical protein